MQSPSMTAEGQQHREVWPVQTHPAEQLQLGQVQVLLPDAFVASIQLQPPEPVNLGFMCGSLPVPTLIPSDDFSISNCSSNGSTSFEAALIPAFGLESQREATPRYRVLPTETDLNLPPSTSCQAEPIFPVSATQEAAGSCKAWAGSYLSQPLARKCEALAVNALAGYGDEIDVVAPVDILKQLFKIPYCKARLSLAVHRIGHTLILNSGPDQYDRGGKLPSQKKSHAQMMERALFSKFVQHSMNGDVSPPDSDSQSSSSTFGFEEFDDHELQQRSRPRMAAHHKGKSSRVSLGHYRHNRCGGRFEAVQKKRYGGEQQRETDFVPKECPNDGPQRPHDNYLRVLFWQFENLRMLLGSDLLLFSNENHSAVSLHLIEIERQVTPLMWLDAWLDNVMASVPELAVCYHRNGVVQGYELLKTDDIFLVKGLSEDGSAFFHPHVVQKNASTVLRFLQDNCKQDPGTYWLLKNSGEDLMQLFDLSVISKTCAPHHADKDEKSDGTLPSTRNGCREHYSLPLAMLLYRLTHRLSLSQDPGDRRRCAKLFGKCLEYMEEQEHLIIRASGYEHMARLILTSFKEIGSMLTPLLLESTVPEETIVSEPNQAVLKLPSSVVEPTENGNGAMSTSNQMQRSGRKDMSNGCSAVIVNPSNRGDTVSLETKMAECQVEDGGSVLRASLELRKPPLEQVLDSSNSCLESYSSRNGGKHNNALGFVSAEHDSPKALFALTDPVSARLAAVHHISQAIKALRWQRQLDVGDHPLRSESIPLKHPFQSQQFPLCICGEVECNAICDFREIAVGAQMDQKLWGLMLLLGEAYLSLGQAYKDEGQLSKALKAAELACLVCGAMPLEYDNPTNGSLEGEKLKDKDQNHLIRSERKARGKQQGLFWGQVWMFIGDVYVEIQRSVGEGNDSAQERGSSFEELIMPQEVMKEVKRLKKKIGQLRGSCGMCSLTGCSCQSDRASSGDSASSCNSSNVNTTKYGRKANRKDNQHKDNEDTITELKSSMGENGKKSGKEYSNGLQSSEHMSARLLTAEFEKKKGSGKGDIDLSDIFSYLRRPPTVDWEGNLSAAVECYAMAIMAFRGFSECSQDLEATLRKKGWACNELGRRRLSHGQIKSAEVAFGTAIAAFKDVKDAVNVVLVHCNLGHGKRAAAENLAAKLSAWENCDFLTLFVQTIAESKFLYGEALKFYGMARLEVLGAKDELGQSIGGLWTEVHTQLAHTYLRLGMLLAREDKVVFCSQTSHAGENGNHRPSRIKDSTLTKDAITKALELYKSLGSLRAQEAAFAQYHLACHHRDSCQGAAMQADDIVPKKVETSNFQRAKLNASLAELYWQKALEFYQPEPHADMFLEILMERSALCLTMASAFHQNQMLEQAFNCLLEGRRAFMSGFADCSTDESQQWKEGRTHPKPSAQVIDKLTKQVQMLLKTMLSAAVQSNKPSSSITNVNKAPKINGSIFHGEMASSPARTSDVAKLKQMYRVALQSPQEPNMNLLFTMWVG
ncbi:unnamed protein product [Calypogeia fissa]